MPRTGAGPEQWVYSIKPQALMEGGIDQFGTSFILPLNFSKGKSTPTGAQPQIESSFWIGAYFHNPGKRWQHFAQVGLDEEWDQKGFRGFKPFYASTFDLDDLSSRKDPTSLKVRNFDSPVIMGLGERVDVSITRHAIEWSLKVGKNEVFLELPNKEFFRDWITIALEDLGKEKVPREIWNGVVYTCTKPYYRLADSHLLRIWKHAQVSIDWNSPPRYIGMKAERSLWRKWFGYPPEKIHFGDVGKPQRWGSLW